MGRRIAVRVRLLCGVRFEMGNPRSWDVTTDSTIIRSCPDRTVVVEAAPISGPVWQVNNVSGTFALCEGCQARSKAYSPRGGHHHMRRWASDHRCLQVFTDARQE